MQPKKPAQQRVLALHHVLVVRAQNFAEKLGLSLRYGLHEVALIRRDQKLLAALGSGLGCTNLAKLAAVDGAEI